MDPLGVATTFATIVSLLGTFSSERGSAASANFDEFMQWLIESNHQELVNLVNQNGATAISIKALLNENRQELAARLQTLDETIAQLATGFDGFREVALSLYPNLELSGQALSLIEQIVDSGASKVFEIRSMSGIMLQAADGIRRGGLSYAEPRFIEDDLNTLVQFGLLRMEYNSSGGRLFIITRHAERFVHARRAAN